MKNLIVGDGEFTRDARVRMENVQAAKLVDMAVVTQRCGGDEKFAAAVARRFCTQSGRELETIRNALVARDAPVAKRAAHSLKSMAAYMGAEAASKLAQQIEALADAGRLEEILGVLDQLSDQIRRALAYLADIGLNQTQAA